MWLSFRMLASTSRCYARNSCLRYFLSTRFTDAFTPARPCSHQQPITKETAEKNSKTDKTSPTSDESSTETKTEQVPVYLKNKPVKAQTQNNQDISKAAGAELVKPGHAQLMEFISLPIEKRYVAKGLFVNKVDLEMLIYPEFHDTDDVLVLEDFCNKVKKLMKNHVDSRQIDIDHELPSVALEKLAHVGVFGAQIPRTYGGLGLNNKEYCALYEILSADFSVLTHWQVSHDLVARTINLFGTEEQKQKYLPGLASGQLKGAFCVHEEDSGQDLCATTTEGQVSEVIDDKIFVSGTKTWVTNGRDADVLIVLAKIRDHGSLEALSEIGTTALIVDRRKHDDKIKILNRRNTSGLRGLNVVDLEFDRIGVTRADILGEMRGGFKVANEAIRHRYAFGVAASAFVKRHIEALQKYTNKTERFDRVLCELTAIKKRFSNMSINAYVLDSMVYYVAGVKDEEPSRDFELEGAMILWFARQALRETLISMEQIQGARSADIESGFERHMRDLSTLNTFMVSDDFLNNFIAMEGLATFAQENKEICEKAANQFEHPMFRLGNSWKFSSSLNYRPKFQHFINEHFHPSLEKASRNVEESMVKLEDVMKTIVSKYGQEIEDDQFVLDRLAEISTLLFASICCLSRSSRSYSIGLRNSDLEMFVAHTFCGIVHWRILRLLTELLHVDETMGRDLCMKKISDNVHLDRGYVLENPLQRNW